MKVEKLGHVVVRVSDLERAERFYAELLGLPISVRAEEWRMTFFTLGSHHDFALDEDASVGPRTSSDHLSHVAFRIAGGTEGLRAARRELEAAGVEVSGMDHVVTQSLYFADPDGNQVEIYVDGDAGWRDDPSLILSDARPLKS